MLNPKTRPVKGQRYDLEFQDDAVQYWMSSGKTRKQVAVELGVSPWSLHRWKQRLQEEQGSVTTPAATVPAGASASGVEGLSALELAQEVGRLRREVEALRRQREILKKAIGICSQELGSGGSR